MLALAGAAIHPVVRERAAAHRRTRQGALTRVTFEDGLQAQPAWSPDGKFIAYSSNQSGNFDIWVQPVGGGRPVRVTNHPANDWQPVWSPDGKRLAFRSERDGGGIFVVPALGGARAQAVGDFGYAPRVVARTDRAILVVLRSADSERVAGSSACASHRSVE